MTTIPAGLTLQTQETVETNVATLSGSGASSPQALGPTVSITPKSTTSKIQLDFSFTLGFYGGTLATYVLYKDGSPFTKYIGDTRGNRSRITGACSPDSSNRPKTYTMSFEDEPGDTSEHTYELRFSVFSTGNIYLNRSSTDTNSSDYWTGVSIARAAEISQ